LNLDEEQIKALAPKENAFKAGLKLSKSAKWVESKLSERAIWGSIQGSGKNPYLVQVDIKNLAYKCSCPSRQFPCKHSLAILLLYANDKGKFVNSPEPDYVIDWIDKRESRSKKIEKEEKEISAEELQKKSNAKVKRQDDRMKLVNAGLTEIDSWLKDLLRLGLLELPNRTGAYFDTMMKRMVDAKTPGLASWIKALKNLDYKNQNSWQKGAIEIISKLHLLISAAKNIDKLTLAEKKNIQGLLGWTFNQKDILKDTDSITLKDQWIVNGMTEENQDDLKIKRYWLFGTTTNQDAIIIRFETPYTNESSTPIVKNSIIEAELIFYPGTIPHRAFIKKQKGVIEKWATSPKSLADWKEHQKWKIHLIKSNPWCNNRSHFIQNVRIVKDGKRLVIVDRNHEFKVIDPTFSGDARSTLLLLTHHEICTISFVDKGETIFPLGILNTNKYTSL